MFPSLVLLGFWSGLGGLVAAGDLSTTNAFLTDLLEHRTKPSVGSNSTWMVERYGGALITMTAFEPDPTTYRGNYYYNTVENVLYKKVITEHKPKIGYIIASWRRISS